VTADHVVLDDERFFKRDSTITLTELRRIVKSHVPGVFQIDVEDSARYAGRLLHVLGGSGRSGDREGSDSTRINTDSRP